MIVATTVDNRVRKQFSAGLPVGFMLRSKRCRRIKLHINTSISSANFIVSPRSVSVVLTSYEKRNSEAERNITMLKRTSMVVRHKVVNELNIFII